MAKTTDTPETPRERATFVVDCHRMMITATEIGYLDSIEWRYVTILVSLDVQNYSLWCFLKMETHLGVCYKILSVRVVTERTVLRCSEAVQTTLYVQNH